MDLTSEMYALASEQFGAKVHSVREDQWANETPCTDWDVRALVNHVIYENAWVPALMGGATVAEVGDRLDALNNVDHSIGAWDASAAMARTAIAAPGVWDRTVHLSYGDVSGAHYAGELFLDLVVHGWDLARGIEADDSMEPDFASALYEEMAPREADLKASGVFGDTIVPPEGADVQTKLLAIVGRVQ